MGLISAAMAPQSYLIILSLTSLSGKCNHCPEKSFLVYKQFSRTMIFTNALHRTCFMAEILPAVLKECYSNSWLS